LNLFESDEELERELKTLIAASRPRLGLVSPEIPLISNLSVWSNIALIPQYHQNVPRREARDLTENLLQRLGMAAIADKRNASLTPEECFCTMVLRAAMVRDAVVVLDRPFRILTNFRDGRFLLGVLRKLDDLIAETYIFDYNWHKERYGVADDAKD
jgi:ABC-type sugar transport system ATPase subunit